MKTYPAIDVQTASPDLTLAIVDDFSPTAVEERDDVTRVFFTSSGDRDAALAALNPRFPATAIDVPDEDWARRSQEGLQPITIGRFEVLPDPQSAIRHPQSFRSPHSALRLVIAPSMGFGTGHHATTRMCVQLLQTIDVRGARVLDVGTGSGILAIAAARLGADRTLGLDVDDDALFAARENLSYNPEARGVTFEAADVASMQAVVARVLGSADIVTANLTGALIVRSVEHLVAASRPGGLLVLSGLQVQERNEVVSALRPATIVEERAEDEWAALVMKRS